MQVSKFATSHRCGSKISKAHRQQSAVAALPLVCLNCRNNSNSFVPLSWRHGDGVGFSSHGDGVGFSSHGDGVGFSSHCDGVGVQLALGWCGVQIVHKAHGLFSCQSHPNLHAIRYVTI